MVVRPAGKERGFHIEKSEFRAGGIRFFKNAVAQKKSVPLLVLIGENAERGSIYGCPVSRLFMSV